MRERVYRTESIILRRNDWGEADRLLTLATPRGKQRVTARGVRKTTSRLAGHLELFTHSRLMLARGRQLDIVAQSVQEHSFRGLHSDMSRLAYAYYVADLYSALTPDEPEEHPTTEHVMHFDLLLHTFVALDSIGQPDLAARSYELHALGLGGYRPQLERCPVCQVALTEESHAFSSVLGGALCAEHRTHDRTAIELSVPVFKLLRYLQREEVEVTAQLTLSIEVRRAAELAMRVYIRRILERELRSVTFLNAFPITAMVDPVADPAAQD